MENNNPYEKIEEQCRSLADRLLQESGEDKIPLSHICAAKQLMETAEMARRLSLDYITGEAFCNRFGGSPLVKHVEVMS